MRSSAIVCCLSILVTSATCRLNASERVKSSKAQVRFLATSWLMRGTFGYNEDKYLVEISVGTPAGTFLAQLVDRYPNESSPLALEVLTADSGSRMRISRDAQCDIPFGRMALRSAPGDLIAILPGPLSFQPQMPRKPDTNELIPCYRLVRK